MLIGLNTVSIKYTAFNVEKLFYWPKRKKIKEHNYFVLFSKQTAQGLLTTKLLNLFKRCRGD